MPKVYKINNQVADKPLPEVYIDSIDIFGNNDTNKYKIKYIIFGDNNSWLSNEHLLKNTFLYIFINNKFYQKKSLISLKKEKDIDSIENHIDYEVNDDWSAISTITVYCSNYYIIGTATTEQVNLTTSTFLDQTFNYINKVKDFRLLNFDSSVVTSRIEEKKHVKNSYISYNKSKKANIAFIFDIQELLFSNSLLYSKIYNSNKFLTEKILETITDKNLNFNFFKKDNQSNSSGFGKINSPVFINRMSSNLNDTRYIISITDDNNDINNYNNYSIKADVTLVDPTILFFKLNFISAIADIKTFLNYYKSEYELVKNNKTIEDFRSYFYENIYYSFFNSQDRNIFDILNKISYIFNSLSGVDTSAIVRLLCSMLHPLTTSDEYFDYLINKLNAVEDYIYKLINDSLLKFDISNNRTVSKYFEQEYMLNEKIDYNYESNYGADIVIQQKYSINTKEKYEGIKKISLNQYNNRKSAEVKKYISSTTAPENVKFLSYSTIIFNDSSFNFLSDTGIDNESIFKDIYYKLKTKYFKNKQYNENQILYQQLLDKNLNIKQVSEGKSTTNSIFFKNILFDVDPNSKQQSEENIKKYNLDKLYSFFIEENYLNIDNLIKNYLYDNKSVSFIPQTVNDKQITYDSEDRSNIIFLIMFFNNFYMEKLLESGENYDIYMLEPAVVNNIFKNNLKIYNQVYIVEKNNVLPRQRSNIPNALPELQNYNIPSIYLNRKISPHKINNVLEDI